MRQDTKASIAVALFGLFWGFFTGHLRDDAGWEFWSFNNQVALIVPILAVAMLSAKRWGSQ